jgi:hypothetical protein
MKLPAIIFSVVLLAVFFIMAACDKSTNPDNFHNFPDPIDSLAQNITLDIYLVYGESHLSTTQLETEGEFIIDLPDDIFMIGMGLNVYARADGFYTRVYGCANGDTIDVDLDAIPQQPYSITGVIISFRGLIPNCYYANRHVLVSGPDNFHINIETDSYGRFGIGDLLLGTYTFTSDDPDIPQTVDILNSANTDFSEVIYEELNDVRAPYLYLYPEETTDVTVELEFLQGGHVTESEPPYNDGWNVNVTPDGTINGEYDYLFYEGVVPQIPRLETGWVINGSDLAGGIAELLGGLGFNQNEIDDFVEFWVPEIEGGPFYAFFYLDPDSIIGLNINPVPDNVLRAFFVICPLQQPVELPPPDLAPGFSRDGFTAVEWGVLGWR